MPLVISAIQTLGDTGLNSLAAGSGILLNAFNNADAANRYMWGAFELNVQFGTGPTAGSLVDLYLIPAPDGTNYDDSVDGASEYAPITAYVGGFPVRAVTSAQKIPLGWGGMRSWILLPPVPFKPFIINNTNQAFPASGSTLKMVAFRT